jgi:hypothetical protein
MEIFTDQVVTSRFAISCRPAVKYFDPAEAVADRRAGTDSSGVISISMASERQTGVGMAHACKRLRRRPISAMPRIAQARQPA